jgi:hypothetical protein
VAPGCTAGSASSQSLASATVRAGVDGRDRVVAVAADGDPALGLGAADQRLVVGPEAVVVGVGVPGGGGQILVDGAVAVVVHCVADLGCAGPRAGVRRRAVPRVGRAVAISVGERGAATRNEDQKEHRRSSAGRIARPAARTAVDAALTPGEPPQATTSAWRPCSC